MINYNSSRDQIGKKNSEYVPTDQTSVSQVWNLQVASNPANGDVFVVTPHRYRIASAVAGVFNNDGYYYVLRGANVSATCSAISASLNLASETNFYGVSAGVTAATAAGSTTDLPLSADRAGLRIEAFANQNTPLVFTQTTANRSGHVLPEGYVSYV